MRNQNKILIGACPILSKFLNTLLFIATLSIIGFLSPSCQSKLVEEQMSIVLKDTINIGLGGTDIDPYSKHLQLIPNQEHGYMIGLFNKNNATIYFYSEFSLLNSYRPIIDSSMYENLSGFFYHNEDSIFIYSYSLRKVFLFNSGGRLTRSYNSSQNYKDNYYPEISTDKMMGILDGKIILNSWGNDYVFKSNKLKHYSLTLIDLKTGEVTHELEYPYKSNRRFIPELFFEVFSFSNANTFVASFAADEHIMLLRQNKIISILLKTPEEWGIKYPSYRRYNPNNEYKFFLTQPSFGPILLAKKFILRYTLLPVSFDGCSKRIELDVFSYEGTHLARTSIDARQYTIGTTLITPKDEILIKFDNSSDNSISFVKLILTNNKEPSK